MRTRITLTMALACVVMAGSAQALTMTGWDVGWNDMATVSGGSVSSVVSASGALQYVDTAGANVSFSTVDMFDGHLAGFGVTYSWADATGDQGQHFFDGAIRNDWYDGPVPALTAADWDGTSGVPAAGSYEWLLNNYTRDANGDPVDLKNSLIRGTDSSFTYDAGTGSFVADLSSDGTWYWYTPSTPDSPMSGWIQDWDWSWDTNGDFAEYYDRYMTGNFRLVGDFVDGTDGLPTFTSATLQYEVAPIPEPATMTLLGLGLAGLGFRRYRKRG